LGIPVVAVRLFRLSDYPAALRFLGEVLGRKERAEVLAADIEQRLEEMKSFSGGIPDKKKVSVYYAIGPDGLASDCDHMQFVDEAIALAGGRNVHRCEQADRMMGKKIDLERVLLYNPEIIITQDALFFSNVFSDPRYQRLRAVRDRKVYMIPGMPFNWLNFPPSFMRAIGVKWLSGVLYPERHPAALTTREVRHFFRLYLDVEISEHEAIEVLQQPDR
jgi:iron complex transport system substrate-binding protein